MMRKRSILKNKIMVDLLKRGKIASKSLANLMLHYHHNYYSALTCRSHDDISASSFISPREYEFSCSNTPFYKRKSRQPMEDELKMMHRMFDILNAVEASPLSTPLVARQARVTDSPLVEDEDVDRDAEEFIKKFYKDLKNQKRIAAMESPSPYHYHL